MELILAEMEFRFKQNQDPKLEEYLSRFPELLTDRLHAIQLATNEFRPADCHDILDKHARVLATLGCLGSNLQERRVWELRNAM